MTIDRRIDPELANREDELSEDKLNAVAGGLPSSSEQKKQADAVKGFQLALQAL